LKTKPLIAPLFFFILLTLISPVHAENEIEFSKIPEQLAEKLSIPLFGAQILASGIIVFIPLMSISLIARGKYQHAWIAEMFVGFMFLAFVVSIGWCPYWLLILLTMLIAIMYAGTMRDLITGRGK